MLTGIEIHRQVVAGNIVIEPYEQRRCNPNSYNLRLDDKLLVYGPRNGGDFQLDMAANNFTSELHIPKEGLVLQPGRLYLGSTMEYTATNKYIPMIEGRSSVARLGLTVHTSAGFGDLGFASDWTLEMTVVHPLRVYAGVEICQIAYLVPVGDTSKKYVGKYQNETRGTVRGPKASRLYREFNQEGA